MNFTVYRDGKREWRWHAKARNGRIVAEGGEGYKRRDALLKSLRAIIKNIRAADSVIADQD